MVESKLLEIQTPNPHWTKETFKLFIHDLNKCTFDIYQYKLLFELVVQLYQLQQILGVWLSLWYNLNTDKRFMNFANNNYVDLTNTHFSPHAYFLIIRYIFY
jgi:hypothetical protein